MQSVRVSAALQAIAVALYCAPIWPPRPAAAGCAGGSMSREALKR